MDCLAACTFKVDFDIICHVSDSMERHACVLRAHASKTDSSIEISILRWSQSLGFNQPIGKGNRALIKVPLGLTVHSISLLVCPLKPKEFVRFSSTRRFFLFAALACPKLYPPDNAQLIPHTCATGKTFAGQQCTVRCRPGFRLIGSSQFHCMPTQQWRTPDEPPRCERIGRIPLLSVNHRFVFTF